jgi:hypothetical protein
MHTSYRRRGRESRLVVEGEPLEIHRFSTRYAGFASEPELRAQIRNGAPPLPSEGIWQRIVQAFQAAGRTAKSIREVLVPSGAFLILKNLPPALQQRYGLEEEEGAVFLEDGSDGPWKAVRFSNGVEVRLRDFREGQPVEVLSLAAVPPMLYERELQTR